MSLSCALNSRNDSLHKAKCTLSLDLELPNSL